MSSPPRFESLNAAATGHAASPNNTPTAMPTNVPSRSSAVGEMTASASAATLTITQEARHQLREDEVLILSLRARPSVRWDENVVDNEGLGRKSSKRCCIFHKQRSFGESSTDSSDYDSDRSGSSSGTSSAGGGEKKSPRRKHTKKIARPKKGKKVPDSQRYHA